MALRGARRDLIGRANLLPWLAMLFLTLTLLLTSTATHAGFGLRPVTSGMKNEIGLGLSYGIKLDKDALFWGYAPDYVRVLSEKFLLNLSFAYDEETETKDGSESVTETWTPSVMIGYQLSSVVAIGGGFGHGIIDNKNGAGWESVKFGDDASVAVAGAASLWSKGRHGLSLSLSLEYNISDSEASVSTDLGYAFGF